MREKRFQVDSLWRILFALTLLFFLGTPVRAQSSSAQDNKPVQNNDTTRPELAQFDQFLDSHMEIAEQLRKDPSLVNNKDFVKNHPVLQTYLQEHPGIREELKENPDAFMRQEHRFDRHEDARDNDVTRKDVAQFSQFLDGHREIAEQLRKDPSLVDNQEFAQHHQALQTYLQNHPEVRQEIKSDPNAFMRQEDRFDRHDDARDTDSARRDYGSARRDDDATRRDDDANRRDQTRFNQFAESHREIAEQLRKDPSLVNNREFVDNHPALQAFMQEQPDIRDEMKANPNAFMAQENRFGRQEGSGASDTSRAHLASFGEFLGGHSDVAQQVSKDPSLVTKHEYLDSHPELQDYLKTHPDVRDDMAKDPQSFVKSAQQFNNNNNEGGAFKAPVTAPTTDSKPKL